MSKDTPRLLRGGKIGQVDATQVPRFAGLATFAKLPQLHEVSEADIAVIGVPFDAGTSFRPGARFGPASIREASRLLRPYNPSQQISPFEKVQVVDAGDIAVNPFDIDSAIDQIETSMNHLLAQDLRVITLGGDHTIAYPILRALHKVHGPLALIHFDAHLDTWDTYFGAPHTHGTPFRRASEDGFLQENSGVHVGIRGSLYDASDLAEDGNLGFKVISCSAIDTLGISGVVSQIKERVGDRKVYVSIDIDVLDPAFAPGTGTPEIGGFTSREMLALLRALEGISFVGADIVEVSPQYDNAQITSIAAANLAYELITIMARNNQ